LPRNQPDRETASAQEVGHQLLSRAPGGRRLLRYRARAAPASGWVPA